MYKIFIKPVMLLCIVFLCFNDSIEAKSLDYVTFMVKNDIGKDFAYFSNGKRQFFFKGVVERCKFKVNDELYYVDKGKLWLRVMAEMDKKSYNLSELLQMKTPEEIIAVISQTPKAPAKDTLATIKTSKTVNNSKKVAPKKTSTPTVAPATSVIQDSTSVNLKPGDMVDFFLKNDTESDFIYYVKGQKVYLHKGATERVQYPLDEPIYRLDKGGVWLKVSSDMYKQTFVLSDLLTKQANP